MKFEEIPLNKRKEGIGFFYNPNKSVSNEKTDLNVSIGNSGPYRVRC